MITIGWINQIFLTKFIVECDTLGVGLGVVPMQKEHPITFVNQTLSHKSLPVFTYEKELMVVVFIVCK